MAGRSRDRSGSVELIRNPIAFCPQLCNHIAYDIAEERKDRDRGTSPEGCRLVPGVHDRRHRSPWLGAAVPRRLGGSPAARVPGAPVPPRTAASGTVWLCRPGSRPLIPARTPWPRRRCRRPGPARSRRRHRRSTPPSTASTSTRRSAPSRPTTPTSRSSQAEVDAAVAQASPFSPLCRVWAPMYRQRTEHPWPEAWAAIRRPMTSPTGVCWPPGGTTWPTYNDGRPVIFIGHSQGAAMLIRLLAGQIDPSTQLRGQMVSAIIAGGNVTVPIGRNVGSTFKHLPLCTSDRSDLVRHRLLELPQRPPADSLFGRPGQGVSLQSGQTATAGVQVACVNPGRHRWRHCRPRPPVPHGDHASAGSLRCHPVGRLPRAVLGQLPEHARCHLAAGHRRGGSR